MHAPDPSDEALLERYLDVEAAPAARDAAFRALVARYRRRVFAVCLQVLGDPEDAEEAAQETLVRLARHGETFRGEAKLSTWLYRVARNVATDRVRHEARRPSTPVADIRVVHEPVAEDHTSASETAAVVRSALEQLDETSRRLLLLVAVEGLSYAEAAAAAALPVGTVKSRVSRARLRLGELLADADVEAAPPRATAAPPTPPPPAGRHGAAPSPGNAPAGPGRAPRGPP